MTRLKRLTEAVIEFLRGADDWVYAPAIREATGVQADVLRDIAGSCGGQILGCHLGYKLTDKATKAEVEHVVENLENRARALTTRAAAITARFAARYNPL